MAAPALVTIIKSDTQIESFTARSGGYSLGSELLRFGVEKLISTHLENWRGEDSLPAFESARLALGWAESVLIIDYRSNTIIWDLPCLEIEPPRVTSVLIEKTNPGWRAAWCPYGQDASWRYLSGNRSAYCYEPRPRDTRHVQAADWFAPFNDPSESFGEDTLFTAILADGNSACWLSDKPVYQVTFACISDLAQIASSMPGLKFEQHPVWPFNDDGYENWPRGGVHLDFQTHRAWRWSNTSTHWDHLDHADWPGWQVFEMGDLSEIQLPYVNGRAIHQPAFCAGSDELTMLEESMSSGSISWPSVPNSSCQQIRPTAFLQLDGTICWEPLLS